MSQIREIPLEAVESSSVHSLGYCPLNQVMRVRFQNGRTYRYENVTQQDFDLVRTAESIGHELNLRVIKNPHMHPHMEEDHLIPRRLSTRIAKDDAALVEKIAERGAALASDNGIYYPKADIVRDLTIIHCNGCRLDLKRLLDADLANLGHDVFGIRRYLDRSTGKMLHFFWPRCAKE